MPNSDAPSDRFDTPLIVAQVVEPDKTLMLALWSRVWAIVILLGILIALTAVYRWNPSGEVDRFFPKCPTFVATGLHCPGCGTLRAMHQLLHGHVLAAMSYNLMTIILLPMMTYGVIVSCVFSISGRRLPCPTLSAKVAWSLLALLILFAVLRNLPYYPLTLLAP